MKSTESSSHQNAKISIARKLTNREPIEVIRFCVRCQGANQSMAEFGDAEILDLYSVLPTYHDVLIEYLLDNGRRTDVCLFNESGEPVALIEVRFKQPVGKQKAQELDDLGIPWLEVSAADVLLGNGIWVAIQDHLGILYLCPACRS